MGRREGKENDGDGEGEERETDRQTDRETERQRDRERQRQRDRQRKIQPEAITTDNHTRRLQTCKGKSTDLSANQQYRLSATHLPTTHAKTKDRKSSVNGM